MPVPTYERSLRWGLAICSLGAAALHFGYAPSHLAQYWLYGVFFVAGSAGYGLSPRFVTVHSHAAAAGVAGATPCEKAGPPATQGQVFNSAGHSHRGPNPQQLVDEPTRLMLQGQQSSARLVAARY